MILIKSSHKDVSTFQVAEWLLSFKKKFTIICETDIIDSVNYSYNEYGQQITCLETTTGKKFDTKSVDSFWYRRGKFVYKGAGQSDLSKEISENLKNEWDALNNEIFRQLESKPSLGSYFGRIPNKLEVLSIAAKIGLRIPKTLITDNCNDVINYFGNGDVISKTISEVLYYVDQDTVYTNKTVLVDISNLPEKFYPSLFQERIKKKYEIRSFYMKGKFYSMAIFSQLDSKTEIDYRNYNYIKPSRSVPYRLNPSLEYSLTQLMEDLMLNTGSIDLIVSESGEIFFLEVNPNGQFGMVSDPCNYYLEKQIAANL